MKKIWIFVLILSMVVILQAERSKIFVSSVGIALNGNGNLGYKPGLGMKADMKFRKGFIGAYIIGGAAYERKIKAYTGYTYGLSVAGRIFIKNFYLSSGWGVSGYESRFRDHGPWKKESRGPFYAVGFDNNEKDFQLSFSPSEHTSPNHVSDVSVRWSRFLSESFILKTGVSLVSWKQNGGKGANGFGLWTGIFFVI